jgi:hypothetical protein
VRTARAMEDDDADDHHGGQPDPASSPHPSHPGGGRSGPRQARLRVRKDVRDDRATERASRAAAQGHGAHGPVLHPERAGLLRAAETTTCCSSGS